MKGYKYNETVLAVLALSLGCASLQADLWVPSPEGRNSLVVKEPALGGLKVNYSDSDAVEAVQDYLDSGEVSWRDLSLIGQLKFLSRFGKYDIGGLVSGSPEGLKGHLDGGGLSWEDLEYPEPILQLRFFEYCPFDKLALFRRLSDPEQAFVLKFYDRGRKEFMDLWNCANDDVRCDFLLHAMYASSLKPTLWETLSFKYQLKSFLCLGRSLRISLVKNGWLSSYAELSVKDKSEVFKDFYGACKDAFNDDPLSKELSAEGIEKIWWAWDQLNDTGKVSNFVNLRGFVGGASASYGDMLRIKEVFQDLGKKGYHSFVNSDGNEKLLFWVLPKTVQKMLVKECLDASGGDGETAKRRFMQMYNLSENDENDENDGGAWDFME